MNTGQITNPTILIKLTKKFANFLIANVKQSSDLPPGLSNIICKGSSVKNLDIKPVEPKYLITDEDRKLLSTFDLDLGTETVKLPFCNETTYQKNDKVLNLQDLHWVFDYLQTYNESRTNKVYLHELLEDCQIILPKNAKIPRNIELEKRCARLRASQQNKEYSDMTKNVDNIRRKHPEDTIAYQVKQMNRHLIAIFQFIMSVLAGFAFGFIGVELLIGNLDFGFRLLLGIICSLVIALAELYFLAKKLNEDLKFETTMEAKQKATKMD